jgi:hypothetical protein
MRFDIGSRFGPYSKELAMSPSRKFFSKVRTALSDPPEWATVWIFGGTYVVAAIVFIIMLVGGAASPGAAFALIILASLLPWLIYWAITLALAAGALALGVLFYAVYLAGRALERRATISRLKRRAGSTRANASYFVVF